MNLVWIADPDPDSESRYRYCAAGPSWEAKRCDTATGEFGILNLDSALYGFCGSAADHDPVNLDPTNRTHGPGSIADRIECTLGPSHRGRLRLERAKDGCQPNPSLLPTRLVIIIIIIMLSDRRDRCTRVPGEYRAGIRDVYWTRVIYLCIKVTPSSCDCVDRQRDCSCH